MPARKSPSFFYWPLLCWLPACLAEGAKEISKPVAHVASSATLFNWSLGLLIVLVIFVVCAWGVRKLSGLAVNGTEQMRIVGGLSLGMREKVILVQAGKKQLILGVTPGRIETLHILENDDCLVKTQPADGGGLFAQKFIQAMKGRSNE